MTKPNFFIVGSMKSGTSTIHSVISSHPEVFMSEPKEPSFFVDHKDLKRLWPDMAKKKISFDEASYLELFHDTGSAKIVGESSSNYAKVPHALGVARRISKFNPDAKILFVLRNPIGRTISHYWHAVKREGETRSILEAIKSDPIYLNVSNYALQINEYLKYFEKKCIFIITLEEFSKSPAETIKSIFNWLDIDTEFVPENLNQRKHVTPKTVRRQRHFGYLNRLNLRPIYQRVRPVIPLVVRDLGQNILLPKVDRETVDLNEAIEYVKQVQQNQSADLRRLLDRNFPEWSKE